MMSVVVVVLPAAYSANVIGAGRFDEVRTTLKLASVKELSDRFSFHVIWMWLVRVSSSRTLAESITGPDLSAVWAWARHAKQTNPKQASGIRKARKARFCLDPILVARLVRSMKVGDDPPLVKSVESLKR